MERGCDVIGGGDPAGRHDGDLDGLPHVANQALPRLGAPHMTSSLEAFRDHEVTARTDRGARFVDGSDLPCNQGTALVDAFDEAGIGFAEEEFDDTSSATGKLHVVKRLEERNQEVHPHRSRVTERVKPVGKGVGV